MIGNRWFRKFPIRRGSAAPQRRRVRPMLEALEDRITPSTVTESAADAATLQTDLNGATTPGNQYVINLTGPSSAYNLASGTELTVPGGAGSITIVGTGQSITGKGNRVFNVQPTANLTIEDVTITGGSGVTQGAGLFDPGGKVALSNVTVSGNTASGSGSTAALGGGIYVSGSGATLTLSNVRISDNNAIGATGAAGVNGPIGGTGVTGGNAQGGGLYVSGGATLSLTATAVNGNTAQGGTGGAGGNGTTTGGAGGAGGAAEGGGAYLSTSTTATSTILNSSFTGNQAIGGTGGAGGTFTITGGAGGTGGNGSGGGVLLNSGTVQILNATLDGNQASGGIAGTASGSAAGGTAGNGNGGGIDILTAAIATLDNNTIYHNTASGNSSSGGGVYSSAATPTLMNNLLLNNTAAANADTNLTLLPTNDNLTTAGLNGQTILGGATTTAAGLVYYPLLPGPNAAIDKGNNTALTTIAAAEGVASGNATDEIGGSRLVNGTIDIGAIEFSQSSTTTTVTVSPLSIGFSSSAQSLTLNASVTNSSGVAVNQGTVTFTVMGNGQQVGSSVSGTVSNGHASATFTLPANTAGGTYTIQASYANPYQGPGNGQFNNASGSATLAISSPPSQIEAAFTIALDMAELVLEANGINQAGPLVFQPPMALLEQILANLSYAGSLELTALRVGIEAGVQFVGASNH